MSIERFSFATDTGLRPLAAASRQLNTSLERLATGKKINRASDDPAGSIAITDFNVRQRVINTRLERISFEQASIGALDGAKSTVGDLLTDLRSLVVKAGNRDALSAEERDGLQLEADSILSSIDFLSNTSEFNGQKLLADTTVQSLNLSKLYSGGDFNLSSGQLDVADEYVNSAIKTIAEERAAVGNRDRDLESQTRTLQSELEAIAGIKSSLEDTDYAKEASELIRTQLLQEAAIFVTKFARQTKADTTLALLNGVKS